MAIASVLVVRSPARLVGVICAAQVLVQIGAFFWPALLPGMMPLWQLSNSEAGWITASFYGAYMVSVPVLVTLTDRIDPKRVYLFGVAATVLGHLMFGLFADGFWSALAMRALTGMGWAGTYMTGLKLLADRVDARMMSRATAGHAASIGISGALSFATGDLIAAAAGWRAAFFAAAASAAVAWLAVALMVPTQRHRTAPAKDGQGLYDFRPVFRNHSAMAYAIAYCVHTLEMSALRGWGVAFLGYVALTTGASASAVSPALVATGLGLIGTFASVVGNEAAIRFGRKRLIVTAMLASILIGATMGFVGSTSYAVAILLITLYGIVIWLDSSSLTAGTAGTAEPSRRGATLAVHSMLGYAGGFVGPLLVGWVLDLSGGMSQLGWGLSFLSVAMLMALALSTFWLIRPRELEGDKGRDGEGGAVQQEMQGDRRGGAGQWRTDPMLIAVNALGITQITAWGTSYYCLGVLAKPIVAETGWAMSTVFLGFTVALLVMGVISTWVGRLIDRIGARAVMSIGTIIVSGGLLALSQVHGQASYFAAWAVLGVGMRCCLYDAAFAALVQVAPTRGRKAISYLTLYGAYASTVFWVIGHYLNESYGWRGTLMIFAAINLAVCLPLNFIGLSRREAKENTVAASPAAVSPDGPVLQGRMRIVGMVLFALIMSINGFLFGVISLQMVPLLEAAGLAGATAIWVASLKGHGQFAGRIVEISFGRNLKAMTIARIAIAVVPASLVLFFLARGDFWLLVAFTLLLGASQGVITIVRGAVPLALFGAEGYGAVLGLIATPILFVNAFSPAIFALLVDRFGWQISLYALLGCSMVTWIAIELMARWYAGAQSRDRRRAAA